MKNTLILGSCTVDIVIPTPKLPTTTEALNSGAHRFSLGGCAYNVSSMFKLFGLPYLPAFSVGTGIYGDYVAKELKAKNIPIFRTSDVQHGACLCLVEPSGERSFIGYHGIEYKFDRSWFKDLDISQFQQVFLCGLEVEEDTGSELVAFLEENRIEDIYFAPGPRLLTIDRTLLKRLLDLHPIIHLNDKEIREYTGADDIESALKILYSENRNDIIVTLGKDGALLYSGESVLRLPARETHAIDTVGAGDCHLGTYMAHRAMGFDKKEALAKANLYASEIVRHPGPTLDEKDFALLRETDNQ